MPRLSVIVPCFNEDEVLQDTHERLLRALGAPGDVDLELVYVDDGSRDRTADLLRIFQRQDARVRVVRLSRNFGHQIALTAGLEHATGDAAVFIDADLQDPPELIPQMLDLWRSGYHVVYGVRVDRTGERLFKRWSAGLFYRALRAVSEVPIPLDTGDFRLIDRTVIAALRGMPERDRFLRGMVAWAGYRQVALPYRRDHRARGMTKYPLWTMLRLAFDGIGSFSTAPLRLAAWTGFAASALAILGIVYALAVRLLTRAWVAGWAGLIISVLFMGGVQLICLGILGEYVARIYGEVKRRPLYLVAERLGFPDTGEAVEAPVERAAPASQITR